MKAEGGRDFIQNLFEECMQIMRCIGAPIKDNIVQEHMKTIDKISYNMKSSMQRDMEKGSSIEAEALTRILTRCSRTIFYRSTIIRSSISKFESV